MTASSPSAAPATSPAGSAPPEFRLFNTMSREVEPFAPADGETVHVYTCGPTVYNPAHLGNFRTFLFEDLLRRTLRLAGWRVEQVMNLTDVDDKIIRRAVDQEKTIREVTDPVVDVFHQDRAFLRIERAEHYPRATEYIPQMIALVERLLANGVAYQADDGSIYFAIRRFPGYGKLSRLDTREIKAAWPRTTTPRRTPRTSPSGRPPRRRTSAPAPPGTPPGGAGARGGTSSARRWPWPSWARPSTSTAAGST